MGGAHDDGTDDRAAVMAPARARRPETATDYAWRFVRQVGPALGVTLLALCRVIDDTRGMDPIEPPALTRLTGKAAVTTARDLHKLAVSGVIIRTFARHDHGNVAYTVPRDVLAGMLGLKP
jgi:hypothetical protein